MYCKNCGEKLNENQAICLKCGVAVGKGSSHCAHCGKEVSESAVVCLSCGAALTKSTAAVSGSQKNGEYLAGKDKTTIIVVCLLLGGIGIHNFMMGESKKGIARIIGTCCTGIGGGILALIDLIKICSGTYVVDPNKLI